MGAHLSGSISYSRNIGLGTILSPGRQERTNHGPFLEGIHDFLVLGCGGEGEYKCDEHCDIGIMGCDGAQSGLGQKQLPGEVIPILGLEV